MIVYVCYLLNMSVPTKPHSDRTELFSARVSPRLKAKLRAAKDVVLENGQKADVITHVLTAAEKAVDEILDLGTAKER